MKKLKTVTVSAEVYKKLASLKQSDETYSGVIERLLVGWPEPD